MPKLVTDDGEVVLDDLTKSEIDALRDAGVEFDLPDADDDAADAPTLADEDEDATPDKLVETDVPDADEIEASPGADDDGDPLEADIVGGEMKHHVDEDRAEDFGERDEDEIEDRYDVKLDDIDKVDDRDRARWANLIRQLNEYGDEVARRKRERDDRIESKTWRGSRDHASLHKRAERNNVISDLKEGFRQMVTRPTPKPATHGPQMDPTNVVRHAAGDTTIQQLFEEEVVVETGERCIGLATDISGSMGSSIDELKIAGGAIAEATEIIGDDFVWEAFTDQYGKSHTPSEERLDLRVVTGPEESFDWEHVDSFGACRNEPTAAGIRDCRMLMEQTSAREYVMIVITDGMALVCEDGRYRGTSGEPVEHAREAVQECRQAGIDVIGLGIGSMDERKMQETFGGESAGRGESYRLTSIDTLAEDILDLYADQLSVNRGGF